MLLRPASGRLRSAALSAALLLASTALHAAEAGPTTLRAQSGDVLKPLPASHDELVFRGENSRASFPVFLSRTEAARAGTLQLGLLNTVSLLPERSSLRVAVNGRMLANMQIRSAEKASLIPVRVPPGVLVPGFNDVQVSVTMTHRVDCSIKATYELWTALDPGQTGFLVPAQAALAAPHARRPRRRGVGSGWHDPDPPSGRARRRCRDAQPRRHADRSAGGPLAPQPSRGGRRPGAGLRGRVRCRAGSGRVLAGSRRPCCRTPGRHRLDAIVNEQARSGTRRERSPGAGLGPESRRRPVRSTRHPAGPPQLRADVRHRGGRRGPAQFRRSWRADPDLRRPALRG